MKKILYAVGAMIGIGLIVFSCQKQPQEVKKVNTTNLKDGSTGIAYQGVDQTAELYNLKSSNMTLINFDDVTYGEVIQSDRYAAQGVYVYPSAGQIWGAVSPCNNSKSLQTEPFSGPYFIFNFDGYVGMVSIEAGDYGADSDEMTLSAYTGLNGTGTLLGSATASLAQGDPSGCQLLELTGLTGARSITVTSVSFYDAIETPNSIYVDNLYFESVIAVSVDIKPGSYPNSINCTNDNALIPVAILSTESFDAMTIDHTTVMFEGAMEWHKKKDGTVKRHEEDVDGDGLIDLVFHFKLVETELDCSSTIGSLTGQTFDGIDFYGEDEVLMFIPGDSD